MSDTDVSRSRVTYRRIARQIIDGETELSVFCPRTMAAVPVSRCTECADCGGLSVDPSDRGTFLRCRWAPGGEVEPPAFEELPAAEQSAAARTKLSAVMSAPVRCATPDMSIESLTSVLLEGGISAVPVVDEVGRAIGVVSKTDLLRRYYEEGDTHEDFLVTRRTDAGIEVGLGPGFHSEELATATVGDIMTHLVMSLPAEASIARGAAMMSYEGVHRLIVTAPDGTAVGVVSSLDILRWMAKSEGFVVPAPVRKPR